MVCARWWYSFRFTLSHGSVSVLFFLQPTLRFTVAAIDGRSGKKLRWDMDGKKRNESVPQFIYICTLREEEEKRESCRWSSANEKNANNAMKMNCAGFFWNWLLLLADVQCTMYILISAPCNVCMCVSQLIVIARRVWNEIRYLIKENRAFKFD